MNKLTKTLSIGLTMATLIGGSVITNATTMDNTKKEINVTTTNVREENNQVSTEGRMALEKVKEIINRVGNDENIYVNKEKYDSTINELLEVLPTLAEQNEVKVGDSIDQSFLGRELEKANEEVAELKEYIDNLPEYQQPMSAEELNALLNN